MVVVSSIVLTHTWKEEIAMKRVLILGCIGGVLLFVMNAVSWLALPWHGESLRNFPGDYATGDSAAVIDFLESVPESGVYHYPGIPADGDMQTVVERSQAGPVVTSMVIHKEGIDPLSSSRFLASFLYNFASATLVAGLLVWLRPALPRFRSRFAFVVALGAFVIVSSQGPQALWWSYPVDFAVLPMLDLVASWAIVGLLFARFTGEPAIARPQNENSHATPQGVVRVRPIHAGS